MYFYKFYCSTCTLYFAVIFLFYFTVLLLRYTIIACFTCRLQCPKLLVMCMAYHFSSPFWSRNFGSRWRTILSLSYITRSPIVPGWPANATCTVHVLLMTCNWTSVWVARRLYWEIFASFCYIATMHKATARICKWYRKFSHFLVNVASRLAGSSLYLGPSPALPRLVYKTCQTNTLHGKYADYLEAPSLAVDMLL